jgi:outer membrane translocation and assembly module TamA
LGSPIDLVAGVTSEQAFRTSFDFVRNSVNLEGLRRLTERVSLVGRYSLEFTRLLNERFTDPDDKPLIDRLFPQVRLSLLGLSMSWDHRNDPLSPTAGTLVTTDVELSSRALGSEVGYVKTYLQGSAFRSLDTSQRTVLAVRGQIGAAHGFHRTVEELDPNGDAIIGDDGLPLLTSVADLPASQRFYAGGGTTVRGFQLDRLGVEEIINPDGLSLGGNGLVVANAEIRRGVCRCKSFLGTNLSAVGFVDSGNVFARASDIDLGRLRGAAGLGMRYNSILGPLRLDFGFKMSTHIVGGRPERGWEYHLSIGEAF